MIYLTKAETLINAELNTSAITTETKSSENRTDIQSAGSFLAMLKVHEVVFEPSCIRVVAFSCSLKLSSIFLRVFLLFASKGKQEEA